MVKKLLTYLIVLGMIGALGHALINNTQMFTSKMAMTYISEIETYGNELLPELQETIANFNPDNYSKSVEKFTFEEQEEDGSIGKVLNKIANWIGTLIAYTVTTFTNMINLSWALMKTLWYTLKILGSIIKTIWYFLYGEIV